LKATLSGALDVIAVKHDDGKILCTPFHVRFGKLKLLRSRDKLVHVSVNGRRTTLVMRVGPCPFRALAGRL
jgi:phosphatidate phosphatase LPIN